MKKDRKKIIEEYYNKHKKEIMRVAVGALGNSFDAETVLQETFETVTKRYNVLISHPEPDKWIFKIVKNMILRVKRERAAVLSFLEPFEEAMSECYTTDQYSLFTQYRGILPDKQLSLLIDFYVHKHSITWMSAKYNMSANSIRVALHRARNKIAEKFADELKTRYDK